MRNVWLIARRDLQGYLHSTLGYVVIALMLFFFALVFNGPVMNGEKPSSEVLRQFFFYASGFVAVASVLFSMRTFAEEKQTRTLVLLQTSPAADWELATGKFFGAWLFLALFIGLTTYMPMLILVNGKIAIGHLLVGYLGLLLLGAGLTAVGVFASSIAPNQLLAAVIASGLTVILFLCWVIARKIEGPLGNAVGYLDLFDTHFRSLSRGILKMSTVVYLLSLTYAGVLATTQVLSQRRWRG